GQLKAGRRLARAGAVDPVSVRPDRITAVVQFRDGTWHRADVLLQQQTDEQWDRFSDTAAVLTGHVAALLDREMPTHLVEDAELAGVVLLPGLGDLEAECDCGAWDHCGHTAALCYQTARLLEQDPFVLLLMRGRGERALLEALESRTGTPGPDAGPAGADGAHGANDMRGAHGAHHGHRVDAAAASAYGRVGPPLPGLPRTPGRTWRSPVAGHGDSAARRDRPGRLGVPRRPDGGRGAPAALGRAAGGTAGPAGAPGTSRGNRRRGRGAAGRRGARAGGGGPARRGFGARPGGAVPGGPGVAAGRGGGPRGVRRGVDAGPAHPGPGACRARHRLGGGRASTSEVPRQPVDRRRRAR